MVVLGGMGNVWGVIIGALLLAWINSTGCAQIGVHVQLRVRHRHQLPVVQLPAVRLILVLMMLFRREGLFPELRTRAGDARSRGTEAEALGADMEADAEER